MAQQKRLLMVIGGSGKSRFYVKPNLMQANTSYAVRLQAFNIPEAMDLTCCDNIHLEMIGDEKTVMYLIIPSFNDIFNFLAVMMCLNTAAYGLGILW